MMQEYKNEENYDWDEWINNVHIKRPENKAGEELEKLLKYIEIMTRPHFYPKKKKKKADIWGGGGGRNYSFATSHKQQVIIKCNYVSDSIEKQKYFLSKYLPQKDKEEVKIKPKLFNATEDEISEETIMEYENKYMDKLFFRMIISPKSQKVPLKILAREFIQNVEEETGYELFWFAAEHHDTGKQHLHILINGKDKFGRDVRFEKVFFRIEFRLMLQNICTALVGPRKDYEIKRDLEEGYRAKRWTKIDNDIKESTRERITADKEFPFAVLTENSAMRTRLKFLQEIGIAKQNPDDDSHKEFILEKHWEDKLRSNLHHHYYEQFEADHFLQENSLVHYYYIDQGNIHGTIVQRVCQDSEYEKDNALVVKDDNGEYWYIPFNSEPPEYLKIGDRIDYPPKQPERSPVSPQKSANLQVSGQSQTTSKPTSKTKSDPEPGWSC